LPNQLTAINFDV